MGILQPAHALPIFDRKLDFRTIDLQIAQAVELDLDQLPSVFAHILAAVDEPRAMTDTAVHVEERQVRRVEVLIKVLLIGERGTELTPVRTEEILYLLVAHAKIGPEGLGHGV